MSAQHVEHGDMREVLARWKDDGLLVDAVVTDAPYHLQSITKRFGKTTIDTKGVVAERMRNRSDGAARLASGFMNWSGDSGEISFDPATWRLCFNVMKPGARLLAFGGSRTFWKIAAAIDAAGFACEDTIFWAYGQGLVLRRSRMKPAVEPILVFRKPGPVRDLNIDECRVPSGADYTHPGDPTPIRMSWSTYEAAKRPDMKTTKSPAHVLGRWPSNLVHDGSDEVLECFPDAPGQIADSRADGAPKQASVYGKINHVTESMTVRGDSGSAARFFNRCEWTAEEQIERIAYQAKAPGGERVFRCTICGEDFFRADRDRHVHGKYLPSGEADWSHLHSHPTLKPLSLMEHLVRLVTPPDGVVLDCFCGTGSTLVAARRAGRDAIGIERDERYAAHARLRLANESA